MKSKKRVPRTSWVTEVHTVDTKAVKEEYLEDFIYKLQIAIKFLERVNDEKHIKDLQEVINNILKKYSQIKLSENPYKPNLEKDSEERYKLAASSWYRMGLLDLERGTGFRIGNFSRTLELTTI